MQFPLQKSQTSLWFTKVSSTSLSPSFQRTIYTFLAHVTNSILDHRERCTVVRLSNILYDFLLQRNFRFLIFFFLLWLDIGLWWNAKANSWSFQENTVGYANVATKWLQVWMMVMEVWKKIAKDYFYFKIS